MSIRRFVIHQACLTTVLAAAAIAPATIEAAQLISTGVRSGATMARFHGASSDFLGPDYRTGFATSLHFRFRLRERISLRPELGWVTKGGDSHFIISFSDPSGGPPLMFDASSKSRLDYIELPILVQMEVAAPRPFRPYLIAGPMVAWNVNEVRKTALVVRESPAAAIQMARIFEDVGTFDSSELGARGFDAGAVGGIGVMVRRGDTRVGLEARYTHGFINLLPERSLIEGGQVQLRNGAFAITALVEF